MGQLWDGFLNIIFAALQFFYGWVHDYGFAIILLTLAMRVILIPLTWKQTKSMYELQRIQPKIKALQEKYKNDKEKLQEETLKFYQENKVNPFGGCLPLLLQMPIFIALFQVLRTTLPNHIATLPVTQQAAAKQFWIILPDITLAPMHVYQMVSAPPTATAGLKTGSIVATSAVVAGQGGVLPGVIAVLPYVIFVALFGLSVWLPQYMITQDKTQRRTGTYMAIFMLYIGWISPAGVLIYWVTSSAWQVGQQMLTMRMLKEPEEAQPAAKGSSKKLKPSAEAPPSKSKTAKGKKSKGA